ncbi:hypothetical protein [Paraburkholderia sp. SIMBA_027]|uniref:hypothetical protein n=1 Tax=Paraburkholderia sp. SIMBA_027 TaxID=3085770 RepID=UPI00397A7819
MRDDIEHLQEWDNDVEEMRPRRAHTVKPVEWLKRFPAFALRHPAGCCAAANRAIVHEAACRKRRSGQGGAGLPQRIVARRHGGGSTIHAVRLFNRLHNAARAQRGARDRANLASSTRRRS